MVFIVNLTTNCMLHPFYFDFEILYWIEWNAVYLLSVTSKSLLIYTKYDLLNDLVAGQKKMHSEKWTGTNGKNFDVCRSCDTVQ